MKLRSDIFESHPLPFALEYGQIGLIHLKIPIWNIMSGTILIEISDVLAVVRPKHIKEWREEVEIEAYKKSNRIKLDNYELI